MNQFRERIADGGPLVVIAHRGASAHAPENTLEAAALGHASGAFAWELDVHLSRDGVPVVVHDESLARTTDAPARFAADPRAAGGFRVADFAWAEIAGLDAGSWFVDPSGPYRSASWFGTLDAVPEPDRRRFASGGVRVPRLVDALALTADLDWRVNVELKTFPEADPDLLGAVLDAIRATGTADRVLISSFDHRDVARAARARPDVATGALCDTPLCHPGLYIRRAVGADYHHASAASLGAGSRSYRARPSARSLSGLEPGDEPIPRLVFTVNDRSLAADLAALGAAGVFTDRPADLLRAGDQDGSSLKAHQTPQG